MNTELSRGNERLLQRLVEISHGKQVSVPSMPKGKSPHKSKSKSMLEPIGPRSLNCINRKKENERILEENQKFAKKLYEK